MFCDGLLVFVVVWGLSLPSLSCFVSVQSGEVVKIFFFFVARFVSELADKGMSLLCVCLLRVSPLWVWST